jgi:hypothetical protein
MNQTSAEANQKFLNDQKSDLFKKTSDYYHNNDTNTWNNPARMNLKFYKQYYEKWEKDNENFSKILSTAKMRDSSVQHQKRLKKFQTQKVADRAATASLKMERLLLEKNSSQKILENGQLDNFLEKINNLDLSAEKKMTLNRCNVKSRVTSKNLWENRNCLNKERLEMDLTKVVLEGEQQGVSMIIKRIDCDQDTKGLQQSFLESKREDIKKSYNVLKQKN